MGIMLHFSKRYKNLYCTLWPLLSHVKHLIQMDIEMGGQVPTQQRLPLTEWATTCTHTYTAGTKLLAS